MKVGIDISPLKSGHFLQHRVRGTGMYVKGLQEALLKNDKTNEYIFFSQGEKISSLDIVHFPYFEPFFLTLPFKIKFPYIVTVHDLTPFVFPQQFPSGIRGMVKWRIQRYLLKKAKKIIADSLASKEDIIKYAQIQENKIEVVYLAPDERFILKNKVDVNPLKKKYNLPNKFALYVGDGTWNKNLPRLLRAVKKSNIPLVMVGKVFTETKIDYSNPWNKDLGVVRALADGNNNIYRLGFISTEELNDIYNMATVFVMPSLYEGFGLPILEAMSTGCPVITSQEGSIPEIAGDAAYFVNAYDEDNIADGIKKVFGDRIIQKQLSKKGLEQSKRFSWEKTAKETIKVYEKS